MIRGIHHTAISTGDLDRALEFYRDLLGFEVAMEFEWPKGTEFADSITGLRDSAARTAMLKAGNMMIEIFEYSSPAAKGGGSRTACVRSRHYAHLRGRGRHRCRIREAQGGGDDVPLPATGPGYRKGNLRPRPGRERGGTAGSAGPKYADGPSVVKGSSMIMSAHLLPFPLPWTGHRAPCV